MKMSRRFGIPALVLLYASACSSSDDPTEPEPQGSLCELNDGPPPNGEERPVLIQPAKICSAPIVGEPPGASARGEVCTWQAVAGATEPGRTFADYVSCDVVRTQRPYFPMPSNTLYTDGDPRLEDPSYVEELGWVNDQIRATGCACCHSNVAPQGPVRWTIDAPGNWIGTFSDRDIGALAGHIDTTMFGRFPPADNNSFERIDSVPSTDPDRMRAFFADELAHRGLTPADFEDAPPTGQILLDQQSFVPQPCECGEGVARDGTVQWAGGPARYIYIQEATSSNPTIPPNLDLPDGTLWRIDVPSDAEPVEVGDVVFGELPSEMVQKYPTSGVAPDGLESGREYKLYVTADVVAPITRCLFVAP